MEESIVLSRNEFAVLNALRSRGRLSQRKLAALTELSLGTINTTVRECEEAGYISERTLTEAGTAALEPYRVDNAIIMAAGLSQRFAPISYEKPKGILRVRGEILIERQIRQLLEAGISDITVVVGYKKEYFFYLRKKFGVKIVVNEEYSTRNNNGTLWVVRERLARTFICSSDNYFSVNPFEPYVYQSYYSAQFIEGETDEWCITTGSGGRITDFTVGGANSWVMLGHVFFDETFSAKFRAILERVYHRPATVGKLWESIYLDHIKDLDMVMRGYPAGVINEFDSLEELRSFDPSFIENVDSEVFDNIVAVLGCEKSEVHSFYPLKQGLTNLSCHFTVGDDEYVYRHPGAGTENLVDRVAEFAALELARDLKLDNTFLAGDPRRGWKISRFIPDARNLDPHNPAELKRAMRMARKLHDSGQIFTRSFDFIEAGLGYEKLLRQHGPIEVPGYDELREKVLRLKACADADGFPIVPSHNDFYPPNFLIDESDHLNLIDWEYAGMSDVANDFGTFTVCAELTPGQTEAALHHYFGREPSAEEKRHFYSYIVFAGWCWYVWSLAKEAAGDNVGELLFVYYRHAVDYVDTVLGWYENAAIPTR
ncbi:MAG: phosphotransferase [Ancrocorticia sp.]